MPVDFARKFPLMTPVKSAPSLILVHGCGVSLFGRRDPDDETGTFVATWCVALLFVPVLCLRAYRVARSPKGWYFLGREPMSGLAKLWNLVIVGGIAATVGIIQYNIYTSSPAYRAKLQMASAATLVSQGHLGQAAQVYQKLALAGADQSQEAASQVKSLLENQCPQAPLAEAVEVVSAAAQIAHGGRAMSLSEVSEDGMKLVASKGEADPKSGVAILDIVRPLVIDSRAIDERRLALLRKWSTAEPNNLEVVIPLASLLEQQGKLSEAKGLLLPVKDKLGDGEGARVLGTILGREGDYDGAYALLWPYVHERLDRLHGAEQAAEDNEKFLWQQEIKRLEENQAPADFYERYKAAGKDQQRAMVQEYVASRIKNDPSYAAAQESLVREAHVVPVALELGIVMLQRAQGQGNAETRKSQLEAAEKVFLAIGGIAGQSDVYRLALGQVDYWLGKQAEGRKLFDEFLAGNSRDAKSLLQVAAKFRELGAEPDSRAMAEEAYNKASTSEIRYAAAQLRSLCFKDLDDQIAWLNRGDLANPMMKATRAKAMGEKAFEEGRDEEAVKAFSDAVAAYSQMPRSATTLNESALAYYSTFLANGDHQALERCTDCFQQAVDLNPSDPVLLFNAGVTLLDAAITDVIGKDIDLRALRQPGSIELLGYLYRDEGERAVVIQRVKSHPGIARSLSYLQKVMVLSPKAERIAEVMYDLHRFTRDEPALTALEARIRSADIDTSEELQTLKQEISGDKDQQRKTAITASLKRGQDRLSSVRPAGGRTAALALDQRAQQMMSLDFYGGSADPDEVLALATEADKLTHSAATLHALIAAQVFCAGKDLRRTTREFEVFYKQHVRPVGIHYLLAAIATEPGPFQQALLQNAHMRTAVELMRQDDKLFPSSSAIYDWTFFKASDSAEAGKVAQNVLSSSLGNVEHSIEKLLHPMNPSVALEIYWLAQMKGDVTGGRDAIGKLNEAGIPMPVGP